MASYHILVVDDEPQILTAITDLLEDEFTVWSAGSGPDALEILERQEVAVILSDQRMPGMTGAEFLSKAKAISDATRVLVTGYSDLDAMVAAVNLGQIHAYLSKPWNPLELKVVVRTAADRWRLGRTLDRERGILGLLMANIPDGIFVKDRSLRFLKANAAQAGLAGLSDPELLQGKRLSDLVDSDAVAAIEAEEAHIIKDGHSVIDRIEPVVGKDGGKAWYSITKVPVREGGEVVGLAGIARDVTRRKEAEDYLKHAHDELQKAVDERTHWLKEEVERRAAAEEQAQSAREAAETANRAKTVFLANMSHELRTPLNAIIGFSELATSIMTPEDIKRYGEFLNDISESAYHLLRVISDILDVSRVEVGKVVLHEVSVDVGEVIRSVRRLIEHVVNNKRQELVCQYPEGALYLLADERLLKQSLLNLASNAAKFTPNGGRIVIAADIEDGAVVIRVTDSGVGISADDIAMVLQPFGQAENAISPKHEGTGLGLPLAKGFVELHGGTLALESEPGQGTRVTIRFPAGRTVGA
jgi:two-component system cell cycle sensor histidine kinase PleC